MVCESKLIHSSIKKRHKRGDLIAKNPLLQKKFEEGYLKGIEQQKRLMVKHWVEKIDIFASMPGVGAITVEKLRQALAGEYKKEDES